MINNKQIQSRKTVINNEAEGAHEELEVLYRKARWVFAEGHFAYTANLVCGDGDAHDRLHLGDDFVDRDDAIVVGVEEGERLRQREGSCCRCEQLRRKAPSARSISASFWRSQRLCIVLRNSSTVMKPLPSASNSCGT